MRISHIVLNLRKPLCMRELIFLVEESDDGGYTARALSVSIFTEADSLELLKEAIKDAVKCHFDDDQQRIVRMHYVKEEVFAA